MSGGSGKRLWPLSNDSRSKQFIKLLKNQDGKYESMIQRMYRQINEIFPGVGITIATGKNQQEIIRNQLEDKVDLVLEPMRRDTFPAIMLSAAYLAYEKKVDSEEVVIVLPVDPYTESGYFSVLKDMERMITEGRAEISLMGIKPTYPSEKYGYILGKKEADFNEYCVEKFYEKPSVQNAEKLLEEGAFWNGGVFAFKLGYAIEILKKHMPYDEYEEIYQHYSELKKISFDYEVVERAENIGMSLYNGEWKDLGTWNTLTEHMGETKIGNVIINEAASDTYVINELDIPLVVLGGENLIVAASPDGILVTDKEESVKMKSYIDKIESEPRYEEYAWGNFKILEDYHKENGTYSKIKHVYVRKGNSISCSICGNFKKIWTVISGKGSATIENYFTNLEMGTVVWGENGQNYQLSAFEDMHLVEIQIEG